MKTEKQLTVVEWFVIELRKLIKESELSDMRPNEFDTKEMMLIEQAKEMEKEQKMDFANWCRIHENLNKNKVFTIQQLFDKYQKETFKSE